ncbi:MAG: LysR substrate-binding domain-containing protein [Oligoflexia bacterium]|nr:LysR substrate-binding domain-containing protein [Oligoflexia bacterium]
MPTITQLEYILAVEKYRHFGKAAAACHISQPTLSVQIQKTEEELNIVIFDRVKKPIIPTEDGKRFLEQARAVVREHQKLLQISKKAEGEVSGQFRLGIIPTVGSSLLPLLVHEFASRFPEVELYVEEGKTESLLEDLKEDRLDGAILVTPLHENGLKEHPLYYEPFLLYLAAGHPLLKKETIAEADLDGAEMWLLQDGHCFKNQVVKFCSISPDQDAVLKSVHFQSGSLETLKNVVRKSRGYTMIPTLFARSLPDSESKAHVRRFKAPVPTREVSLVYRRDRWKTEIISAIEKTIAGVIPSDLLRGSRKEQVVLEIQ